MKDEILICLRHILEALEMSEPKQKHYTEPVERHANAIKDCGAMIDKLEAIKEDEFYSNF